MTSRWSMLAVVSAACLMLSARPAFAVPLNFEFSTGACPTLFGDEGQSAYGGFTWGASWAIECNADYSSVWGNTYGATSGTQMAFNAYGEAVQSLSSASLFNFLGLQVSSFTISDVYDVLSASTLTIDGMNGATVSFTHTHSLLAGFDSFFSDYAGSGQLGVDFFVGIDALRFTSGGGMWLMDDLDTSPYDAGSGSAPVPEPASLLLLGSGLAAVAHRVRRKTTLALARK